MMSGLGTRIRGGGSSNRGVPTAGSFLQHHLGNGWARRPRSQPATSEEFSGRDRSFSDRAEALVSVRCRVEGHAGGTPLPRRRVATLRVALSAQVGDLRRS
jgi:hypothetical protein